MNQIMFIALGTTASVVFYAAVQQITRRRDMARFATAFRCLDQVQSSQLSFIRKKIDTYGVASFFHVLLNPPPFHLERVFSDIDFEYDRLENLSDDFIRENKALNPVRRQNIEVSDNSFDKQRCRDEGRWYEK